MDPTEFDLDAEPKKDNLPEWFEQLWKSWPTGLGEKGSKANAKKQFEKIKLDEPLFSKIRLAINQQAERKAECKTAEEFYSNFPHVERWLRNKRWEDELEASTTIESKEVLF